MLPPGQYRFQFAPGENMRVGNERLIRLNGLPTAYRDVISSRVQDRIAQADRKELLALYALSHYY